VTTVDLTAFQFTLNYDAEKLSFISCSAVGTTCDNPFKCVCSAVYGKAEATIAYPGPGCAVNGDSQLLTLAFEVIGSGSDTLTITDPLISDKDGNLITPDVESLTLSLYAMYDLNGDGVIDYEDLELIKQNMDT